MFAWPVREVELAREETRVACDVAIKPGENALGAAEMELLDFRAEIRPESAEQIVLTIRGVPVVYDVQKAELSCKGKAAPLRPVAGAIRLRVLRDRGSLEIFANDGRVAMSVGALFPPEDRSLALTSRGGTARVVWSELNALKVK